MSEFYRIHEIMPGVYRINSDEQVFMELFVGSDKALLYDTGFGFGDLKKAIREITDLPLIIVNSHSHMDHTGGNYQFEEDCFIHHLEIEVCKIHNSEDMRKNSIEVGKKTQDYLTGQFKNILPESFDETEYIKGGAGNLVSLQEDHVFDLGGIKLKTVLLPGHTPGGMGLLYMEEKILYVGDAINPFVWMFMPEALKLSDYIRTIKKAMDIDFSKFYMAHNPIEGNDKMLEIFLDCAENIDYEKGFPFQSPLARGLDARICTREGYTPNDIMKPGFASVVLSPEHI